MSADGLTKDSQELRDQMRSTLLRGTWCYKYAPGITKVDVRVLRQAAQAAKDSGLPWTAEHVLDSVRKAATTSSPFSSATTSAGTSETLPWRVVERLRGYCLAPQQPAVQFCWSAVFSRATLVLYDMIPFCVELCYSRAHFRQKHRSFESGFRRMEGVKVAAIPTQCIVLSSGDSPGLKEAG